MNNTRIAYSEVDEILNLTDEKLVNKISKKVRDLIKEEKDKDYKPNIDPQKPLYEQNLLKETVALLTVIELNYWCESEEEKQEILKELSENDIKKEQELRDKYNPDNLFKKDKIIKTEQIETTAMVEYKEKSIIRKILDKIKDFFKR